MGVELEPIINGVEEACLGSRRFAILIAGHASEYIREVYGGVACLFNQLLSDPGETWDTFHVIDGKFPSEEDLHVYDAFIITGSRHDAHGSEPWVLKLCEVVRKVHKEKRKLLGICFGHQVISRALGGKTGRSMHGWEVGLKEIMVADAMYSKPYALKLPSSMSIIEIHQDQVFELPPGGERLASSKKTSIEMFAMGDHVLGIQGHPEFTEDITLDILNVCSGRSSMPEEVINEARLSFKQGKADHDMFKQLCKSFLKAVQH